MADPLIYLGVAALLVVVIGWLLLDADQDMDEEDEEWDFTTSYPRRDR